MLASELSAVLSAFTPHDAREAGFVERMQALCGTGRPFARDQFSPGHFTASAFVLSPERDAVLLIFHRKLGIWVQPGGHVEADDATMMAAARREVLEEVGLAELVAWDCPGGVFDVDVHAIPARPAEPAHEHFDVRFLFVSASRKFAASAEVADARWVPLTDVESVSTDESVLRAIRKARALLDRPREKTLG